MGKGLQVDKIRSKRSIPVFVPQNIPQKTSNTTEKDDGLVLHANCWPPPFFSTWEQYRQGKKQEKKKTRKGNRLILGKNRLFKGIPILGAIL